MAVTTFNAIEDAQIHGGSPGTNSGSLTSSSLYEWSDDESGVDGRILIKFDLSAIPSNATINSAYLTMVGFNSDTAPFAVTRITSAWSEGIVTWLNKPNITGSYGTYTPPMQAEVRFSPGWNVTQAMRDNLAEAKAYGFAIYNTGVNSGKTFYMRESGKPPQLTVDYTIPNTAPNAPVLGWSDGQALNTRTPTVTWTFSDPDGNAQGSYFVQVVNSAYSAAVWDSVWINDANARSYTIPAGVITSDGQWYIRMKVSDSNGAVNQANGNGPDPSFGNRRIIVDTAPPTISSVSAQQYNPNVGTNTRVWAYGLSDATTGVSYVTTFLVRPDGSYYQYANATNGGNGNWYVDISWNGLPEGTWGVDFRGVDGAGNTGNMVRALVTVDSTAPTLTALTVPQFVKGGETLRFWVGSVNDSNSGINRVETFVTRPDGSSYQEANAVNNGGGSWYKDLYITPNIANGQWYIDFYAVDNAGNRSSRARMNFYFDNVNPTVGSVQGYSYTNNSSGTRTVWIYGISDVTGIKQVDGKYKVPGDIGYTTKSAIQSGSDWYITIPISVQGEYEVIFYPLDNAGNVKADGYKTNFFVDSQLANDPRPSSVYDTTQATINWMAFYDPSPSSGYLETRMWLGEWNGSDWVGGAPNVLNNAIVATSSLTLEKTLTGLTPGARYRYTVAHFDKANNKSSFTWFEFVTKRVIGQIEFGGDVWFKSLRIYDPQSGVFGSKAVQIQLNSMVGCFELVSINDPNASAVHISTPQGVKAISL